MEAVMNPYEVLGVDKDASAQDIKMARRRKAQQVHPDREGGNGDQMAQINRAYKVLADPHQRAYYDQTGRVHDEKGANTARMRGMLTQCIRSVLEKPGNVVVLVQQELQTAIDEGQVIIDKFERTLNMNRARLDKVTGPEDEPNLFVDVISATVKDAEKQLAKALTEMGLIKQALELVNNYFSDEPVPPPKVHSMEDGLAELLSSMAMRGRR